MERQTIKFTLFNRFSVNFVIIGETLPIDFLCLSDQKYLFVDQEIRRNWLK